MAVDHGRIVLIDPRLGEVKESDVVERVLSKFLLETNINA
jgi:hypothetical protein